MATLATRWHHAPLSRARGRGERTVAVLIEERAPSAPFARGVRVWRCESGEPLRSFEWGDEQSESIIWVEIEPHAQPDEVRAVLESLGDDLPKGAVEDLLEPDDLPEL